MEYCNFQCYQEDLLVAGAMTGQAMWFDDVEKMIYNAAKGATRKDWTATAYMSRVNQYASETPYQEYRWRHAPPCCTHSAVISLPLFVSNMMMHDRDGNVFLTAYGPCRLHAADRSSYRDHELSVRQDRRANVRPAVRQGSRRQDSEVVRPAGSDRPINGTPQPIEPGVAEFFMVRKAGGFTAGDTITIIFDAMDRVAVRRHPQLPNQLWIERGPLLFACEVPTVWKQYPLKADVGYKLSPEADATDRVKGYSVACSDAALPKPRP